MTSSNTKMRTPKQKTSRFLIASWRQRLPLLVLAGVLIAGILSPVVIASADSFQDQIDALNSQKVKTQGALDALQLQASSYQDAINKLQAQISGLQAAIDANIAKQAQLEAQIATAQQKLDEQKAGLAQDLKAMYVSDQMSPVEMLATSKSLSDYINAETYSSAVQDKIQATLAEITALQDQLKDQKQRVEELLAEEQQQKTSLASAEGQQQHLLSMNQSQQDTYNSQIRSANSQIATLRAQQLAANESLGGQVVPGDPGHGGYPASAPSPCGGRWGSNYSQDDTCDNWGMFNRECVSYAAWKVFQTYGYMPYWGGQGNAIDWPDNARRAGIPTGSTPRVNSVAIWPVGYFGHAMWVEAVSGNMVYVSQFNYDFTGHYSEMWVNGSNFTYIYFH